jgi:hypothetical protein
VTRKITLLILFLSSLIVLSPTARAATIPPDIKNAVTFIFLADQQGDLARDPQTHAPRADGTGFFVGVKSEQDPSRFFGYLVTAKHVVRNAQGSFYPRIYIRLNKKEGDAEYISLDLTRDGQSVVSVNSDPTVDIVVIPALPSTDKFDFKVLPDDMLTTEQSFKELNIGEGSDVFFAGLFVAYYGEHRNNPIIRFGRVAMLPEDRVSWRDDPTQPPKDERLYLIETQTYGGNSGSPVFFSLSSELAKPGQLLMAGQPLVKLAGVMMGYFNEPSPIGLLQTPTATIPYSRQNIGIAAVTPSYLLREILFSAELKKTRADYVEPSK